MNERSVALYAHSILTQVREVIVGKDAVLRQVLTAILAKGHILLEDVPGVGKTTMALAFSRVLDLDYSRVQFTPDVLPSDVTGYSVPDKTTGEMHYQTTALTTELSLILRSDKWISPCKLSPNPAIHNLLIPLLVIKSST